MTRNFSNQRRDGMHPSSRNSASGKSREEQSFKPARPRLSRDAVDRAWENGATRTYADYRPRQNPSTSPTQRQGRPAPAYERSRQPHNQSSQGNYGPPHTSVRPGGYQQEGEQRHFNRPGYRAGSQPALDSERWTRNSSPQQPGNYTERNEDRRPPRFQQDGPEDQRGFEQPARFQQDTPNNYRGLDRSPRFQQDGPENYRGSDRPARFQQDTPNNYRGSNRPPRSQQDGPENYRNSDRPARFQQDTPNNYRGSNHPPRSQQDGPENYRGSRQPARFQQDTPNNYRGSNRPPRSTEYSEREREQFARGQRGSATPRDNYNPRWQSRPAAQRDYSAQRSYEANEQAGREQFEGDYERFTEPRPANTHQTAQKREQFTPADERPVTRLPDGRVLKGSRPSQNKQANFWNGVEEQTGELLANAPTLNKAPEAAPEGDQVSVQETAAPRIARPQKPGASRIRKVKTVKTTRAENEKPRTAKVARKNAQSPQKPPVTRPSRRGYKWPAVEESNPDQ
ncbi:MAG TPA: hypothetical protein VGD98_05515 [Ktedonobacteraceae bacterium]